MKTVVLLLALFVFFVVMTYRTVYERHMMQDPRCNTPARYEAMAQGADCFTPRRN